MRPSGVCCHDFELRQHPCTMTAATAVAVPTTTTAGNTARRTALAKRIVVIPPLPSSVEGCSLPMLPFDVLLEPPSHHRRDLEVVFLEHHHVPVAMDPDIRQPEERVLDTRLHQVFRGALIVGSVVTGLARDDQDRDTLERRQLVGRLALPPAPRQVGTFGRRLLYLRQL